MATLTSQTISRTGLIAAFVAASGGGDEFINTGTEFIRLKNDSAGTIVATIATPNSVDTDLAIADRTVSLAAGVERDIGPWPVSTYNDSNQKVQLTYDGVTSLTIAVIKPGV